MKKPLSLTPKPLTNAMIPTAIKTAIIAYSIEAAAELSCMNRRSMIIFEKNSEKFQTINLPPKSVFLMR